MMMMMMMIKSTGLSKLMWKAKWGELYLMSTDYIHHRLTVRRKRTFVSKFPLCSTLVRNSQGSLTSLVKQREQKGSKRLVKAKTGQVEIIKLIMALCHHRCPSNPWYWVSINNTRTLKLAHLNGFINVNNYTVVSSSLRICNEKCGLTLRVELTQSRAEENRGTLTCCWHDTMALYPSLRVCSCLVEKC